MSYKRDGREGGREVLETKEMRELGLSFWNSAYRVCKICCLYINKMNQYKNLKIN